MRVLLLTQNYQTQYFFIYFFKFYTIFIVKKLFDANVNKHISREAASSSAQNWPCSIL